MTTFTGQLGTADSQLGRIQLGAAPPGRQVGITGSVSTAVGIGGSVGTQPGVTGSSGTALGISGSV